ncbi:MAG: dicarboxylate/amino acid:cation symporter [Eubacteriales bacterium]|nr:dicarboxylate/amino acid:cation symporter [Eubacteriales bacterium]
MKRIGLLPRLLIGIVLGIILGLIAPQWLMRAIVTVTDLFGNYLNFIVPLIIVAFVVPGIADLGRGAGRVLGFSVFMSYASTVLWAFAALGISILLIPMIVDDTQPLSSAVYVAQDVAAYFSIDMPPLANITSAIILAFMIGVGISLTKAQGMRSLFNEFHSIIALILDKTVIPFLPVFIAGIFAQLAYSGGIVKILGIFGKVFLLVVLFQFLANFLEYVIASIYRKGEPSVATFIRNQVPSWITAMGTQSSAATIPITLQTAEKNGTSQDIRDFFIPLSATIHFPGSSIAITIFTVAVIYMEQMTLSLSSMIGFILLMGITMVAAPGIPGGAVMAALGLLQVIFGFNETQLALMIALYLAQDSFGTACSVAGNCALVTIIDKRAEKLARREQKLKKVEG